jgi:hypothetical protein
MFGCYPWSHTVLPCQGFQPLEQRFQIIIDRGEQDGVVNAEITVRDSVATVKSGR